MFVTIIRNISFRSVCGKPVKLKEGDHIFLDVETMIGYHNGVHFDMLEGEYQILH